MALKNILVVLRQNWQISVVCLFVLIYCAYFSTFTILRTQHLYAHYYDLGIMHQVTHNSYRALATGDWDRMLEQTNPFGPEQIKRMAIHNDIMLALISPLYFIHDGPETLLVVQAVTVGLGAFFVFALAWQVFKKRPRAQTIAMIFALLYLFNPLVQRANIYEFHSVTLSTTLILGMFYFWQVKRYGLSLLLFFLSLLTKENVPLTTACFGLYILVKEIQWKELWKKKWQYLKTHRPSLFAVSVFVLSVAWFFLSVKVIIPYFRVDGEWHFAMDFYAEYGDSPVEVIIGVLTNPMMILSVIFSPERLEYFLRHFGYGGFLAFLSPLTLAMSAPEFAINTLSSNDSMRNPHLHYTALITPIMFISMIFGSHTLIQFLEWKLPKKKYITQAVMAYLISATVMFAWYTGPLPGARMPDTDPLVAAHPEHEVVKKWAQTLENEDIKICTTGRLAPYFTNRRYFYDLSSRYKLADYVIVWEEEAREGWGSDWMSGVYDTIQYDDNFKLVDSGAGIDVFMKTDQK